MLTANMPSVPTPANWDVSHCRKCKRWQHAPSHLSYYDSKTDGGPASSPVVKGRASGAVGPGERGGGRRVWVIEGRWQGLVRTVPDFQ